MQSRIFEKFLKFFYEVDKHTLKMNIYAGNGTHASFTWYYIP